MDRIRDTPRASCVPRDRGGWSARRAAAGSAVRAAVWRARCASASRRRTFRTDGRRLRCRIRARAARSRCAGPCCSRHRAGTGPEARRSARASHRVRPAGPMHRRACARCRASPPSCRAAAETRCWLPRRPFVPSGSGHPAAGSRSTGRPASRRRLNRAPRCRPAS